MSEGKMSTLVATSKDADLDLVFKTDHPAKTLDFTIRLGRGSRAYELSSSVFILNAGSAVAPQQGSGSILRFKTA